MTLPHWVYLVDIESYEQPVTHRVPVIATDARDAVERAAVRYKDDETIKSEIKGRFGVAEVTRLGQWNITEVDPGEDG